ncbi:MAG: FAD-dependent oxidoreductase [Planctomycetota bacterium]|nr:FAD-dependent oxidoreductase [Planctomycetota bacterium]
MTQDLPTSAQVVIIGGGIIGCSVAYHLAKLGTRDIVILERGQLTCGSTFHAAGLVGQLRSSASITQLLKYSVELYDQIEAETGQATGWRRNGGLRLACNEERWTEVRRQATTAHSFGLEMHLLSPKEAQELWPLMDIDDLVGAAFLPTDGQVSPGDLARSLSKGAQMAGATCVEDCTVTAIDVKDGVVGGVQTSKGSIQCEVIVNCAGLWAREIGRMAGVNVPVQAVQHQFMVTEPIEGITPDLPTLRDPDRLIYFKEEVGGVTMGGYELDPIPWALGGIPDGWIFKLIDSNWDHFENLAEQAFERMPALGDAGVRQLINGPEAFTPDGTFILGEAPEVRNYFVGAGFNAFGIAAAGGAGKALAEWIVGGEPSMDLWPVDIRRFGHHHREDAFVLDRTLEAYSHHYTMSWPHEEFHCGRPIRKSPLFDRLQSVGASFGEKMGWERPNWFAPAGVEAKDVYTYGYQNWFPQVGEEHTATREAVALFDSTSFAKYLVQGRDAEAALSWICANDVRKPPGRIVYTQMLNQRGGIECDLTVARLDNQSFYIVTGTGYATHDAHWIRGGFQTGQDVQLHDITDERAVIGLMGPHSRDVLSAVTTANLSNDAFPYMTWQDIEIEGCVVRAMRLTFVGELGWELHIPAGDAGRVYDAIHTAGQAYGLQHAGYRAIESLRLEKGYRIWGKDIGPDYTPLEAGLGFATKLKTDIDFRGRQALEAQAGALHQRLACFTVEDPSIVLLGRETIYRNGDRVGWLTSGGFGYTVGKPIGYGYVRNEAIVDDDFLHTGIYELEIAGEMIECELHLKSLYDPTMGRVRM